MTRDLGDAIVRARGLALHLLSRRVLEQLSRSAGSGVLTAALQGVGYGYAPPSGEPESPASAAESIDDGIERETARRLELLARWLGPRRAPAFAGVFEDEERRALHELLRRTAAGAPGRVPAAFASRRRLARSLADVRDPAALARVLTRHGSPYGPPLERALGRGGADLRGAADALDRTWAGRAVRAARVGGRLAAWVSEGIDLENAWDALLQAGGAFLEGGARLSRAQHAAAAADPGAEARRRRLTAGLGDLGRSVFDDPGRPLASLEAHALAVRIDRERRFARLEPLGPAPILEFVLRLRAERADLRRINAGVAFGLPPGAIARELTPAGPGPARRAEAA